MPLADDPNRRGIVRLVPDEVSHYRSAPPECPGCEELRRKLAAYEARDSVLRPHQSFSEEPGCIGCHALLYQACEPVGDQPPGKYYAKKHADDERFCTGQKEGWWWARRWVCPPTPHVHRYCDWCGARWLERTAADEKERA